MGTRLREPIYSRSLKIPIPANKRNKNKNKNKQKQKQKRPRKKNNRSKQGKAAGVIDAYAKMIKHPCDATLVPGIFGTVEGMMARSRVDFSSTSVAAATSGYVLWSPEYHNAPGDPAQPVGNGNAFIFVSANPDTSPSNGSGVAPPNFPYGSAPLWEVLGLTASMVTDPIAKMLVDDMVQDARTISACVRVCYTGKMQNASGEIAFLHDVPYTALLGDGAGAKPLTISQLFQYSTRSQRLGVETYETVWHPTKPTAPFRSEDQGCVVVKNAVVSTVTEVALVDQPTFFGFAWRGMDNGQVNPLTIDLIKNVEWRASTIIGLTHTPAKQIFSISPLPAALKKLDSGGNWVDRIVQEGSSMVNSVAKMAFTGAGNYIAKEFTAGIAGALNFEEAGLGILALL